VGGARSRGFERGARGPAGVAPGGAGLNNDAYRAAEETARYAYGRLVAFLAKRAGGDLAAAEDALADAFAVALERWPRDGVPAQPEAWIVTAARRRLIDAARRDAVRERMLPHLVAAAEAEADEGLPDQRLAMLFACAHPAIDAGVRTPLILRAVLGIDAGRIASAFLVSPAAMRQRLVRAKTKIRDAGIAFVEPEQGQLRERVAAVLEAIYAAFGLSWDDAGADGRGNDLNREAIWLARVVAEMMPNEAEAQALLALVLYVEARRDARRVEGRYIPLDEQDPQRWSSAMLNEADAALTRARGVAPGRFSFEAAIQAEHVARRHGTETNWREIARLYDGLAASGAVGALVSRAAAHARAYGPQAGLVALAELPPSIVALYQPYWALRAHLTGEPADYDRAIGLAKDDATRAFLAERRRAPSR
jgi:RNA polymerase sigma-70 factor (ECF subfamily)